MSIAFMSKSVLDDYFAEIQTGTSLNLCSDTPLPAERTNDELLITSLSFMITDITPSYTRTSDSVLTVEEEEDVLITTGGSVTGIVLHDGTNVLHIIPIDFDVTVGSYVTLAASTITHT